MKYEELTGRIIKVFYDVYNELGFGFSEKIYERAMIIALSEEGLKVDEQVPIKVNFRGQVIGEFYADIVMENSVVLELKTASSIVEAHEAQLLNYLKASEIEVGLIMNFGPKPDIKRMIFDNERKFTRIQRMTRMNTD